MITQRCVFCGTPAQIEGICVYSMKERCSKKECLEKSKEYGANKDRILAYYADEKERVLRPIKEQLDTELFLLDRDSFKHT